MRYVILRDDDTNAFTPVECLERLYRPFLDRGLPVNLAVIPDVRTDAVRTDQQPEQFLFAKKKCVELTMPIGDNEKLTRYLLDNPGFQIVQHGYDHTLFEFDSENTNDICDRLEQGTRLLLDAGFTRSHAFVAPYDKFSRTSLRVVAGKFRVISTGWFELRRLPRMWWPRYALKKYRQQPHWRVNGTILLTHPGCLLSQQRSRATMFAEVKKSVLSRRITVLVTHWWEYFDNGKPDEPFIQVLHETASWLAGKPDVKVVSFDDVAQGNVPLD
jgi:hypothetical protein